MFGFECSSDDDWDDYDFGTSVRRENFNPTTAQTKAFEKLAKLKEKFPGFGKPRELVISYRDKINYHSLLDEWMPEGDFERYCGMYGDFNGNESTNFGW